MNEHDENLDRFGSVIEGLGRLAGDLKQRQYPGKAWTAPRKRRTILLWPAAAAVAAAIAIGVFVIVHSLTSGTGQGPEVARPYVTPAPSPDTPSPSEVKAVTEDIYALELISQPTDMSEVSYQPQDDDEGLWPLVE